MLPHVLVSIICLREITLYRWTQVPRLGVVMKLTLTFVHNHPVWWVFSADHFHPRYDPKHRSKLYQIIHNSWR